MNKKAQLDAEVFAKPGFWALAGGGIAAVALGYKWSKGMDSGAFPLWQVLVIMLVIIVAAYIFSMD